MNFPVPRATIGSVTGLWWLLFLLVGGSAAPPPLPSSPGESASAAVVLFEQGESFDLFARRAAAHRALWTVRAGTSDGPELRDRLRRVSADLRLLVVAEDWCVDSANTVPFLSRLADGAGVPLRVIGRVAGRALMDAHRTSDGRHATPLVVFIRSGRDAGAWVERPAELQHLFRTVGRSADAARAFSDRQAWYDRDRGHSALLEIVQLAEQSAVAGVAIEAAR